MTEDARPEPSAPQAPSYRIRLQGHVGARLTDRFDAFEVRHEADGTTTLTGHVVDQAALHGLLRRIRDLSLTLVAVTVDPAPGEEDGRDPLTSA